MNKAVKMLPYLAVNALAFYLMPLLITDTGMAMTVLLIGMPAVCFVSAMIFGMKNRFQPIYVLLVALLFIPSIFIFYNSTATIYVGIYGGVALVGNLVGYFINKNK